MLLLLQIEMPDAIHAFERTLCTLLSVSQIVDPHAAFGLLAHGRALDEDAQVSYSPQTDSPGTWAMPFRLARFLI